MSTESRSHAAAVIRSGVMRLHDEVRSALRETAHLTSRAHRGDLSCLADLRAALQRLAAAVRRHNSEEQRLLDPFLETVDAWGTARVERLQGERDLEAKMVETASSASDPNALVRTACSIIRPLAQLLRSEELEALPPDVLRDDVVAINQEDG